MRSSQLDVYINTEPTLKLPKLRHHTHQHPLFGVKTLRGAALERSGNFRKPFVTSGASSETFWSRIHRPDGLGRARATHLAWRCYYRERVPPLPEARGSASAARRETPYSCHGCT